MQLKFAAEICKFRTNGCSANSVLLKTGSSGGDEYRRTELQIWHEAQLMLPTQHSGVM